MVIKIIKDFSPLALALVLSCSYQVQRKVGSCDVLEQPYGAAGFIEVRCGKDQLKITFDNDPEGRDEFILRVEGKPLKRVSIKKIDPYRMESADVEMEGYAVEEVWKGEGITLRGFEFFTEGGYVCYDWEEGYKLELERKGDKLVLLERSWEGTECR